MTIIAVPISARSITAKGITAQGVHIYQGPFEGASPFLVREGILQPGSSFLRTGSVTTTSGTFGANVPARDGALYVHHGQIDNRAPADLTSWSLTNMTVTESGGEYTITRTAATAVLSTTIGSWTTNDMREVQVKALSLDDVGKKVSIGKYYLSSPGTDTTLTADWQTVTRYPGDAGYGESPNIFYAADMRTDATVTGVILRGVLGIDGRKYRIAPIRSEGPAVIDTAASDIATLHGHTVSQSDTRNTWLWDIMDGGSGTLSYKDLTIVPTLAQWITTGGQMILLARSDGTRVFYVDQADGLYKIYDGTNTAMSPSAYVADASSDVDIVLDTDEMWIRMDGVDGVKVPFVGTLIGGTPTLKFNYLVEDVTLVGSIKSQP